MKDIAKEKNKDKECEESKAESLKLVEFANSSISTLQI